MYSITARRMTSGLVLKYLKEAGLVMGKSYATVLPASRQVLLTRPALRRVFLASRYQLFIFFINYKWRSLSDFVVQNSTGIIKFLSCPVGGRNTVLLGDLEDSFD